MPIAKRIDRWPDFDNMSATSYGIDDGRRYVLFGEEAADESLNEMATSRLLQTRIGYREFGGRIVLLGILLSKSDRGSGQGERLIEYFLDNVGHVEGEFHGTGLIHKPIVSLQLSRVGLNAEQDDFKALLLPRSAYDGSPDTPKIVVLEDNVTDRSRIVTGVGGNRFYEEVDHVTAKYIYPARGHDISLHCEFRR